MDFFFFTKSFILSVKTFSNDILSDAAVSVYARPASSVNIAAQKTVTNENPVLERLRGVRSAAGRRLFCRKGLTGLQRGPYSIATRPPLQDNNGPVAPPGGPYGRTNPDILARKSGFSAF